MLAITLVLAGTTFSFAQNPDKDELVKRIQEYAIAYNKGDAKATASLYAVNGYHAYATGITHQGRTQIEQGLSESFEGPMKGTQIILNSDDIRFISSSIAYEHSSFLLSGVKMPDGTAIPTIKGYCLGVYEKQDGVWYALAMQCMVPLTPPQ
jgi:uncharacterized protein (TIGR02246 family)